MKARRRLPVTLAIVCCLAFAAARVDAREARLAVDPALAAALLLFEPPDVDPDP